MKELKRIGFALAAIASLAMLATSIAPSAALTLPSPAREPAAANIQIENADYQDQGDRQLYRYDQRRHHQHPHCWRSRYGQMRCKSQY